jgi:hypothetical protein
MGSVPHSNPVPNASPAVTVSSAVAVGPAPGGGNASANANANNSSTFQRLKVEDALSYLDQVPILPNTITPILHIFVRFSHKYV